MSDTKPLLCDDCKDPIPAERQGIGICEACEPKYGEGDCE